MSRTLACGLWLVGALACSGGGAANRNGPASPATPTAVTTTTCDDEIEQARRRLEAMDPSVTSLPPAHLPLAAGASVRSGHELSVAPREVAMSDHVFPDDDAQIAEFLRIYARNDEIAGRHRVLHLVLGPSQPLRTLLPRLALALASPFYDIALLVQPGLPAQLPPAPGPADRMRFERLPAPDRSITDVFSILLQEQFDLCPTLNSPYSEVHARFMESWSDAWRELAREIPDALRACDCKADTATIVALTFYWNAIAGTTVVRAIPAPDIGLVRDLAARDPNMTVQQMVDAIMADEELSRRAGWTPYRQAHLRLRASMGQGQQL